MFSLVFQPGSMGSDSHRLFLYRLTLSVTFAKVCKISPQHCNCQFKRFNPQVEKNPSNTHTHTPGELDCLPVYRSYCFIMVTLGMIGT